MPDKRFEDKVSVNDLLKKPAKEIQIMTYLQTIKTNGTVTRHDKCIETLEKDMKDKIGLEELERSQKIFNRNILIGGSVLVAFNIFDRVMQYLGG